MRNLLIIILVLFGSTPSLAQSESTPLTLSEVRCDITDEQTVYWAATQQFVTLRTRIYKLDEYLPRGQMSLILENGIQLDLGEGGKYIDDADAKTLMDCRKHLTVAKADTLHSLGPIIATESRGNRTLESMWAYSVMGQDCMDSINRAKDGPSFKCEEAANFRERFNQGIDESSITGETYRFLRDNAAPIITVRKSTYFSESYVYDARDNKLYHILTEGC